MKIALYQQDIVWNDIEANHQKILKTIDNTSLSSGTLVLLAEMFNTGFSFAEGDFAAEANRKGTELLAFLATRYSIYIGGSLPNPNSKCDDRRCLNTLYVYGPSGLVASYDKIHTFGLGGESERYQGGQNKPEVVSLAGAKTLLSICYDLRFSYLYWDEAFGIDLIVVPANWPSSRQLHWDTLIRARAIENQTFVAAVNRIGEGGGLLYTGGTALISPLGEELISFAPDQEGIKGAEIDIAEVARVREKFPFLKDRRS